MTTFWLLATHKLFCPSIDRPLGAMMPLVIWLASFPVRVKTSITLFCVSARSAYPNGREGWRVAGEPLFKTLPKGNEVTVPEEQPAIRDIPKTMLLKRAKIARVRVACITDPPGRTHMLRRPDIEMPNRDTHA
jgi:hypothetical protein